MKQNNLEKIINRKCAIKFTALQITESEELCQDLIKELMRKSKKLETVAIFKHIIGMKGEQPDVAHDELIKRDDLIELFKSYLTQ